MKLSYATVLVALLTQGAWAFHPKTLESIKAINENYKNMGTGELVTAWGGWKRSPLLSPSLKGKVVKVPTQEMETGQVEVYFFRHPSAAPKPFIVFFPGIFGHMGSRVTGELIRMLEQVEAHILVVPNFLSDGWIRSKPKYDRHPAKTEVFITNDIWKEIGKEVPLTHVSNIHVIGESLGTLLASAWVAETDFYPRPKTLTLLWPPAALEIALDNLDEYVTTGKKNSAECGLLGTFPAFVWYFLFSKNTSGISESHDRCLSAWGAQKGFLESLDKVSKVVTEVTGKKVPKPKSFKKFFESQHPPFWKAIQQRDEMLHLSYWLKTLVKKQPETSVRILTSYDDFLNRGIPVVEEARRAGIPTENVVVFDWGGHSGPIVTKEFQDIIQYEWSEKEQEY